MTVGAAGYGKAVAVDESVALVAEAAVGEGIEVAVGRAGQGVVTLSFV